MKSNVLNQIIIQQLRLQPVRQDLRKFPLHKGKPGQDAHGQGRLKRLIGFQRGANDALLNNPLQLLDESNCGLAASLHFGKVIF